MAEVGELVRKFRQLRNMSVSELAESAKLTRDTIYKIERGDTGASVGSLKKLARALDVPPAVLVE